MLGRVPLTRPALIGLYHAVGLGPDRVQVCNAGRSVVLTAPGNAAALVALLHALDGTASLDELTERFSGLAVSSLIATMAAHGLLIEGGDPGDGNGRARATIALHGPDGGRHTSTQRLRDATVVVAGCGPVSAAAAVALAKAGAGCIVLADDRPVSDNDVSACPVLAGAAVGQARSVALMQVCAASSEVRIAAGGDATTAALDGATVAIIQGQYGDDAIVAPAAEAALRTGTTHIVHWQDALEVVISPVIGVGGRPCHRCMESRRLSHVAHLDEHLAYLAHRSHADPEPDSFLAAHTSLAAGLLSTRVLQHITATMPDDVRDAAIVLDLATSEWRREVVLEVPGCSACSAAGERAATQIG